MISITYDIREPAVAGPIKDRPKIGQRAPPREDARTFVSNPQLRRGVIVRTLYRIP
jgi:hypothetical protein